MGLTRLHMQVDHRCATDPWGLRLVPASGLRRQRCDWPDGHSRQLELVPPSVSEGPFMTNGKGLGRASFASGLAGVPLENGVSMEGLGGEKDTERAHHGLQNTEHSEPSGASHAPSRRSAGATRR
jgi:hypothetical protein